MDDFLSDSYIDVFYQWILQQDSKQFPVSIDEKDSNVLWIKTDTSESEIIFNKFNIIEFRITNLSNHEVEFYLHFQMKTLQHAIELFKEMIDAIQEISKKPTLKVLLCCSGGLSTTYFANQLQEAANLLNLHMQIDATNYHNLYKQGQEYDIILLAPQISYQYAKIQKVLSQKVIMKISPKVFAQYDVGTLLSIISNSQKKIEKEISGSILNTAPSVAGKLLCLSFFRNSNRVHISYRIYDNNEIVEENKIVKHTISINDIYDTIDTIIVRYPGIEIIGISIPGIINDGHLSSMNIEGLEECDLQILLIEKYHCKVSLSNDVNTVAVGYHAKQDRYSSLAFVFQPISFYSGVGIIINDQLIVGRKNIAGEAQFLPMNLSDEFTNLTSTPEGSMEVVSKTIVSIMSIVDPQAIILYCDMIPDIDDLIDEISTHISREYIPEIIKVTDMQDYILHGVMIICSEKY